MASSPVDPVETPPGNIEVVITVVVNPEASEAEDEADEVTACLSLSCAETVRLKADTERRRERMNICDLVINVEAADGKLN